MNFATSYEAKQKLFDGAAQFFWVEYGLLGRQSLSLANSGTSVGLRKQTLNFLAQKLHMIRCDYLYCLILSL